MFIYEFIIRIVVVVVVVAAAIVRELITLCYVEEQSHFCRSYCVHLFSEPFSLRTGELARDCTLTREITHVSKEKFKYM